MLRKHPQVMQVAAALATDHRLGIRDVVILSVASQAGCGLLLSEDSQQSFTWGGRLEMPSLMAVGLVGQ